jgi:hypothetical protein
MRSLSIAAIAVAGLAWGCVDTPDPSVTSPEFAARFANNSPTSCRQQTAKTIATEQDNLYDGTTLVEAEQLFEPVADNCSKDIDAARSAMLAYIQWTIDNKDAIQAPATFETLISHWNTVFPYVGYTGADQPAGVPASVLETGTGAAGVITQATVNREIRTPVAALTLPVQSTTLGDPRPHLFVIYPRGNNCLTGTNLRRLGPCYEFASFPHVSPKFSDPVKVGICQPEGPDHGRETAALGHLSGGFVEIPNQELYPACTNLTSVDEGSWTGGFGAVLKRVASLAQKTFGVTTAYAVHGGLGGLGEELSPFGGVDREVFLATFENVAAGTVPDSAAPEVGTWTPISVTPPGSIFVQSLLGESGTGNLVVLNQAGGACKNCGGLLLQGNLSVAPGASNAMNGIYEATFIALQDNANMKSASFKLRDSRDSVLAQVTFTVAQNANKVLFNGTDTGVRWVRHVPLSFRIRVNINAGEHAASLWVQDTLKKEAVPFLNTTTNFANISADFGGIDSGVMGWDQIRVVRLEDQ